MSAPAVTFASARREVQSAWSALREAAARASLEDPAATVLGSRVSVLLDSRRTQVRERAARTEQAARDALAGYPADESEALARALRALAAVS